MLVAVFVFFCAYHLFFAAATRIFTRGPTRLGQWRSAGKDGETAWTLVSLPHHPFPTGLIAIKEPTQPLTQHILPR